MFGFKGLNISLSDNENQDSKSLVTTRNKNLCLSALVLSKLYRMVRTFEAQNLGADTVEVLLLYSDNLRQSHHTRDSILVKNSKIPKSIEKKKL